MANLVLEPLEGEAAALPDPLRHLLRLVDAVHLLPLELLQRGQCRYFLAKCVRVSEKRKAILELRQVARQAMNTTIPAYRDTETAHSTQL